MLMFVGMWALGWRARRGAQHLPDQRPTGWAPTWCRPDTGSVSSPWHSLLSVPALVLGIYRNVFSAPALPSPGPSQVLRPLPEERPAWVPPPQAASCPFCSHPWATPRERPSLVLLRASGCGCPSCQPSSFQSLLCTRVPSSPGCLVAQTSLTLKPLPWLAGTSQAWGSRGPLCHGPEICLDQPWTDAFPCLPQPHPCRLDPDSPRAPSPWSAQEVTWLPFYFSRLL